MPNRRVSFYGPGMRQALGGSPIQRDYMMDPRRQMGQQLLAQGSSTAPVQSPLEGLTRALTAGVGGYFGGQARQEMRDREGALNEDVLKVMAGGQAQPWINPDTGTATIPGQQAPGGMGPPTAEVPTGPAGGYPGMQAALGGIDNPDIAPFAQQLGMKQMDQEQAMQIAEAQRAAKLSDQMALKAAPGSMTGTMPSNIAEWNAYQEMTPEEKEQFLIMKRANPYLNLGGQQVQPSPTRPGEVRGAFDVTPKPEQMPEFQGESSEAKAAGGKIGAENTKQYFAVQHAFDQREDIGKLVTHLETSDAVTGFGAEMIKDINRLKAQMGSSVADGTASDTEILDVMMGKEVFPMIKSLGVGARGMDTPAEREFMRSVLTGSISLNKTTLIKMAQMRADLAERTISRWNKRMESGELDRFYKNQGIPKTRFELNAPAPQGALPQDVTEDDIVTTMRANNMTREQVLQRLGGQ